jgi:hypothetical protein
MIHRNKNKRESEREKMMIVVSIIAIQSFFSEKKIIRSTPAYIAEEQQYQTYCVCLFFIILYRFERKE